MELQQRLAEDIDKTLELADRKSLFQILSFFDGQLPQCCAVNLKHIVDFPEFSQVDYID